MNLRKYTIDELRLELEDITIVLKEVEVCDLTEPEPYLFYDSDCDYMHLEVAGCIIPLAYSFQRLEIFRKYEKKLNEELKNFLEKEAEDNRETVAASLYYEMVFDHRIARPVGF